MSAPDFSIIIPTFERPQTLAQCLEALGELDREGPTFEVIVVDDGGGVALDRVIDPVRGRLPLRLLRQEHAGPAAARNAGVRVARGRWLAFTDDDCQPDPQWLRGFARGFAERSDLGLGGRTLNLVETNVFCVAHQLLVDYVTRRFRDGASEPGFFASNNIAFPAEALRPIGGFDTSFPFAAGEDRDLCTRWLAAGHTLAEAPAAIVRHHHLLGLGHFCRMHHRYGRGARRFRRKIAERQGSRVRLEPTAFYAGLLLTPLSSGPAWRAPSLCAVLLLSQICHATGFARQTWSE